MVPNTETCLVSIWSTVALANQEYDDLPIQLDGWKDSIKLVFDDVTEPQEKVLLLNFDEGHEQFITTPFDDVMAYELTDFIIANEGTSFIVHCDAGFSRSVAVGSFMASFYGYTPVYHEAGHDGFRNILVCNLLRRAYIAKRG